MSITICGHSKAMDLVKNDPKKYDVLFISSPQQKYAVYGSQGIEEHANEYFELLFDDVTFPIMNRIPPTLEDVKKALDFGVGKKNLIVCCQAGISRSSAIAYLIKTVTDGMAEGLTILNPMVHSPNSLIIKHGSLILKNPDIVGLVETWKVKADGVNCWN